MSEQLFPLLHFVIVFLCDFVLSGREFHLAKIDDLVPAVDDKIYLASFVVF